MYQNLKQLLTDRHISAPMYATVIEVAPSTAQKKIKGEFDHTLSEAKKAMTLFPEYSMEYVFEDDGTGFSYVSLAERREKGA